MDLTERARTIDIYHDGVWAGKGALRGNRIEDCPAVLGECVYEAIEAAILYGYAVVTVCGHDYEWEVK